MAAEAAHTLQARLHIVYVVPRRKAQMGSASQLIGDSLCLVRGSSAARRAQPSPADGVPAEGLVASVAVLSGSFVQQAAAYSAAVEPTWIVIGDEGAHAKSRARALARTARRPVFVPPALLAGAYTGAGRELGAGEPIGLCPLPR